MNIDLTIEELGAIGVLIKQSQIGQEADEQTPAQVQFQECRDAVLKKLELAYNAEFGFPMPEIGGPPKFTPSDLLKALEKMTGLKEKHSVPDLVPMAKLIPLEDWPEEGAEIGEYNLTIREHAQSACECLDKHFCDTAVLPLNGYQEAGFIANACEAMAHGLWVAAEMHARGRDISIFRNRDKLGGSVAPEAPKKKGRKK